MIRRALLRETGWDGALDLETLDAVPEPRRDQVLVEVEACGVCYRDLVDRRGGFPFMRLPIVPGHEAVGRVVAVGDQATRWQIGDRVASMHRDACGRCKACEAGETSLCDRAASVLGLLIDGGYATHLVAPETAFYASPDELPASAAAILHCTFGTAWRALTRWGEVAAGAAVLVTGANGGVGSAAVQLAHRLGADVVAVVRDERHVPFVEGLGAARVLVDRGDVFHKRLGRWKADVAVDCVGPPTFASSLKSLQVGGKAIAVGNVLKQKVPVNLGGLITRGLQVIGSSGASPSDMASLLALHAEAPLTFPVCAEHPLDEAERAQRAVRAGGLEGRIVLRCHT